MFVAIGIIILFASFIVALFSLIAEQRKQGKQSFEADPQAEAAPPPLKVKEPSVVVDAPKVEEVSSEPFRWEAVIGENNAQDEVIAQDTTYVAKPAGGKLQGEILLRSLNKRG